MELAFFDQRYKEGLMKSKRYETMRKALDLFAQRKSDDGTMVETGTTRQQNDWGAGMSTLVFGDVAASDNHHLWTVDIDPKALYVSRYVTRVFENSITYVESDSIAFLKKFGRPIDFLYLDSMDCPEYDDPTSERLIKSQTHQLLEMEAAFEKLAPDPVILLDDNQFENGGKTRLSKVFLAERGFTEVLGGAQSLWIRSK